MIGLNLEKQIMCMTNMFNTKCASWFFVFFLLGEGISSNPDAFLPDPAPLTQSVLLGFRSFGWLIHGVYARHHIVTNWVKPAPFGKVGVATAGLFAPSGNWTWNLSHFSDVSSQAFYH